MSDLIRVPRGARPVTTAPPIASPPRPLQNDEPPALMRVPKGARSVSAFPPERPRSMAPPPDPEAEAGFIRDGLASEGISDIENPEPFTPRGPGYVEPADIAAGAKPTVRQSSGNISTEKTINFEADGRHYVIPTIVGGVSLTRDAAINEFRAGKNKPIGTFGTQQEATDFAEQRSRSLDDAFGGGGRLIKGPSDPASGSLQTSMSTPLPAPPKDPRIPGYIEPPGLDPVQVGNKPTFGYAEKVAIAIPGGVGEGIDSLGEQAGTIGRLATGDRTLPAQKPGEAIDQLPLREKIKSPEWTGKFAGEAAASSTPFLGGAAAGGTAGFLAFGPIGGVVGAMLGGGAAAGTQQLADTYVEARRAGQSHDQALDTAIISGATSAGINAASIPVALVRFARGPLTNLLVQSSVQVGIGGADQAAQNVVAQNTFDPKRPTMQGVPEAMLGEALFEAPATAMGGMAAAGDEGAPQGPAPNIPPGSQRAEDPVPPDDDQGGPPGGAAPPITPDQQSELPTSAPPSGLARVPAGARPVSWVDVPVPEATPTPTATAAPEPTLQQRVLEIYRRPDNSRSLKEIEADLLNQPPADEPSIEPAYSETPKPVETQGDLLGDTGFARVPKTAKPINKQAKAPNSPQRPRTIVDAIRQAGGIAPSGETRSRNLSKLYPGLVSKNGKPDDHMAGHLGELGFFGAGDHDPNMMWDMIDQHIASKGNEQAGNYHPEDVNLLPDWIARKQENPARAGLEERADLLDLDHSLLDDSELLDRLGEGEALAHVDAATSPAESDSFAQEIDDDVWNLIRETDDTARPRAASGSRAAIGASAGTPVSTAATVEAAPVPGVGSRAGLPTATPLHAGTGPERTTGTAQQDLGSAGQVEGDGAGGGSAAQQRQAVTSERVATVDGSADQFVMPGTQQSAVQAAKARETRGRGKIVPTATQKEADHGLFAPPPDTSQNSLFDAPASADQEPQAAVRNEAHAAPPDVTPVRGQLPEPDVRAGQSAGQPTKPATQRIINRVHHLAEQANVDVDTPEFRAWSKHLTGTEHLDDMSPDQLGRVINMIGRTEATPGGFDLAPRRAAPGTKHNPKPVTKARDVKEARDNIDRDATDAQKAAGNYQKGHITWKGLGITIETGKGHNRTSTERDDKGKPKWSVRMPVDYGYVKRTEGADGEGVDIFMGPNPNAENVYVIDQQDAETGAFDEHKVMAGFNTRDEAVQAYDNSFSDGKGPKRRRNVTEMNVGRLKRTLPKLWRKKPVYRAAKSSAPTSSRPRGKITTKIRINARQALEDLGKHLRAVGLPDVTAGLMTALEHAKGARAKTVVLRTGNHLDVMIKIGRDFIDNADKFQQMGHEFLHAMRGLNLITPAEWRILERAAAKNKWMKEYEIAERYPDLNAEEQLEEAIAEAAGDYYAGKNQSKGRVAAIFDKILNAIKAFGNWAKQNGINDANDVFSTLFSGAVGTRERGIGWDPSRFEADQRDNVVRMSPVPKSLIDRAVEYYRKGGSPWALVSDLIKGERLTNSQIKQIINGNEELREMFESRLAKAEQRRSTIGNEAAERRIDNAHAWLASLWIQHEILIPQFNSDLDTLATEIQKNQGLGLWEARDKARETMNAAHSNRPQYQGATLSSLANKIREASADRMKQNLANHDASGPPPGTRLEQYEGPAGGARWRVVNAAGEEIGYGVDRDTAIRSAHVVASAPGYRERTIQKARDKLRVVEKDQRARTAKSRKKRMLSDLGIFQPLDRALRIPFDIFGGVNERGEWNWGRYLFDAAARIITDSKPAENGAFNFINPLLETARAGLIDRYGLPGAYVDRDRQRALDERVLASKVPEMAKILADANVGPAEARVLQKILTGEDVSDADMSRLAEPIREALDQMGQEAVQLGLLSKESYERNKGKYVHRVYAQHENDQKGLVRWVNKMATSRRKKIIGNQFKGRGLWTDMNRDEMTFNGRDPQQGDVFTRYEWRGENGQGNLIDIDPEVQRPLRDVKYFPAGQPVPERYAAYTPKGDWEVRSVEGEKVNLWRDYSEKERADMGEITDARYTVAKTYLLMAHDLATGRFYHDIALNADWSTSHEPAPGTWKEAANYGRFWRDPEIRWVRVPETLIEKSNTKRYGQLAGRYVRAEIWRDINEVERMQHSTLWNAALTSWKKMKTARNPVVHMNNVMSNLVLMDMADVGIVDLARGIKSLISQDAEYKEAQNAGTFGHDIISQEIHREILEPVLKEIQAQAENDTPGGRIAMLGKLAEAIWSKVMAADRKMMDLYRLEDEVFRMAMYHRLKARGVSPKQAAEEAREQFIDYDIRAPMINALRRSVLPFISYTYRAVPMLARMIATKPWKLAKYFTIAFAANAIGYALFPGDEDEERRALRDEEQGYTWTGAPRMIRMPWADDYGNPVFLDIRRWIPAGDVFDMNQSNGAFPVPAPLQFGGPLMLAAELALNRQAFTGKDIVNEFTDDASDRAEKIGGYLWRSWMPSAPWVPGSWYYQRIERAVIGGRDPQGNPYSVPQAVSSSMGVKLKPLDVEFNFAMMAKDFERVERELKIEAKRFGRDYERGLITEKEYNRQIEKNLEKLERNDSRRAERIDGIK